MELVGSIEPACRSPGRSEYQSTSGSASPMASCFTYKQRRQRVLAGKMLHARRNAGTLAERAAGSSLVDRHWVFMAAQKIIAGGWSATGVSLFASASIRGALAALPWRGRISCLPRACCRPETGPRRPVHHRPSLSCAASRTLLRPAADSGDAGAAKHHCPALDRLSGDRRRFQHCSTLPSNQRRRTAVHLYRGEEPSPTEAIQRGGAVAVALFITVT